VSKELQENWFQLGRTESELGLILRSRTETGTGFFLKKKLDVRPGSWLYLMSKTGTGKHVFGKKKPKK
jgi:hypothetical protein